jgi:hypothetical protein
MQEHRKQASKASEKVEGQLDMPQRKFWECFEFEKMKH